MQIRYACCVLLIRLFQLTTSSRVACSRLTTTSGALLKQPDKQVLRSAQEGLIAMILDAEVERVDAANVIVAMTGRMTLGMRLHEVEAKINTIVEGGTRKLILDLSGIEYADSAGLGMLMLLYGRMKIMGGQLRLVAPSEQLLHLFKLTCTDSILTVDPDRDAALAG